MSSEYRTESGKSIFISFKCFSLISCGAIISLRDVLELNVFCKTFSSSGHVLPATIVLLPSINFSIKGIGSKLCAISITRSNLVSPEMLHIPDNPILSIRSFDR